MLKEYYDCQIIGYNYISLIRGLLSLKSGSSTLMVNDKKLIYANQWFLNIGYLERSFLNYLGHKFDIEPLIEIDGYLQEQNSLLYLNQKLMEFSDSPYANIKEIARKLPECFGEVFRSRLESLDSREFDSQFFELLDKISKKAFEEDDSLSSLFEDISHKNLAAAMDIFNAYVQTDSIMAKQIHFVIQVMYQTAFSAGFKDLETKYLFLSLISPRFKVDGNALASDLLLEYRKIGGDIKDTIIEDWGIKDNKLEYVQLGSIDGNVKIDHTYYFAQDHYQNPFDASLKKNAYKSIFIDCSIEHKFIDYFQNKRIVFAPQNRMGSDFPYWELQISEDGKLKGIYSFADDQGTKPSFYYPAALDDIYESLRLILPGMNKSDWISRAQLYRGQDVWFEFQPKFKAKLLPEQEAEKSLFSRCSMRSDSSTLEGISHCGPDRGRSLGLYSYMIDIFSS